VRSVETLDALCLSLLQSAESFCALPDSQRKAFIRRTAATAFNKVIRRLPEIQAEPSPADEDESPDVEQDVALSSRRCDWKLSNASEDAIIARIDAERAEKNALNHRIPEQEPTDYEQAVLVLGVEDADWYWNLKADAELYRERSEHRTPRTRADQRKFERLAKKLAAN
jgi:hypothetical protein